jgi:hypothetical protein
MGIAVFEPTLDRTGARTPLSDDEEGGPALVLFRHRLVLAALIERNPGEEPARLASGAYEISEAVAKECAARQEATGERARQSGHRPWLGLGLRPR